MLKVGDKVYYIGETKSWLKHGKLYNVTAVSYSDNKLIKLSVYLSNGVSTSRNDVENFITELEFRKQKINKIKEKLNGIIR